MRRTDSCDQVCLTILGKDEAYDHSDDGFDNQNSDSSQSLHAAADVKYVHD